MPDSGANLCFELSYFQILDNLCRYSFFKLIELKLILLSNIKPIKYKSDNIIIDEIKEIMWWDEFCTNNKYEFLAKNPAIPAAATGLNIQFEMSKTMQDTCNNLIKYKIVLRIVVINSANKYALNP